MVRDVTVKDRMSPKTNLPSPNSPTTLIRAQSTTDVKDVSRRVRQVNGKSRILPSSQRREDPNVKEEVQESQRPA